MNSYYIKSANDFRVYDARRLELHSELPVGVYRVAFDQMSQMFFLQQADDLSVPSKLYGTAEKIAERVVKSFIDRKVSTGVALYGEKGSGKTMTVRLLSRMVAELGYPTLVVNEAFHGDAFNAFVASIDTPIMLAFDEFEKVYTSEQQEALLTLLDGMYTSGDSAHKRLFVFTMNNLYAVSGFFRNRPGRIYYSFCHAGMSDDALRQYAEDNLKPELKESIQTLVEKSHLYDGFNFDAAQAIVEEMNRFDFTVDEAMEGLNVARDREKLFQVDLYLKDGEGNVGQKVSHKEFSPGRWTGNPYSEVNPITVVYADRDGNYVNRMLPKVTITSYDHKKRQFTMEDAAVRVVLTDIYGSSFVEVDDGIW